MFGGGKFTSTGNPGAALLTYVDTSGVSVFAGSQSLTYTGTTPYSVGPNVEALIAADLNGDSVIDIAVTYQGDQTQHRGGVGILLNKGDGTFNPVVNYPVGVNPLDSPLLISITTTYWIW